MNTKQLVITMAIIVLVVVFLAGASIKFSDNYDDGELNDYETLQVDEEVLNIGYVGSNSTMQGAIFTESIEELMTLFMALTLGIVTIGLILGFFKGMSRDY